MNRWLRRSVALFLVVFSFLPLLRQSARGQAQAESAEADTTLHPTGQQSSCRWYTMFANVPHDIARFSRITFRSSNIPIFIGMATLTTALIATDDETWRLSDRFYNHSITVRNGSDFFEYLGDGRPQFGLAAGFALYGFALGDQKALHTGSQTVEALLACGITVQAMKRIAGRESPAVATSDRGVWRLFPNLRAYQQHQSRYYAFPSGHIATTMATVTVIAENYPEVFWIRPVGYSLAGCLGFSLVNVGYHWYSDLPLGAAIGYMFGMIAAHREDGLFAFLGNDPYSGLRVLPAITQDKAGVTLALLFMNG